MKTRGVSVIYVAILLALVSLPLAAAVEPADGKSQHLDSPEQIPQGLAKSDWQSIRQAYEAARHAFQPVEDGWQARNTGQQWTTKFDKCALEHGFTVAKGLQAASSNKRVESS